MNDAEWVAIYERTLSIPALETIAQRLSVDYASFHSDTPSLVKKPLRTKLRFPIISMELKAHVAFVESLRDSIPRLESTIEFYENVRTRVAEVRRIVLAKQLTKAYGPRHLYRRSS